MFKKTFWIFGLLGLILVIFLPGYTKLQELRDRNKDLEDKSRRLAIENAVLTQELKRIENDTLYREKILREKMSVVRKDEIPVKIITETKE
ncbi:hypothetical protein EPO66_03670 [bacterium]|nr:MAG: hypothetical protein EPO66_03670 [bacterium]